MTPLKNWLLVIVCGFYSLARPSAKRAALQPRRVVIVQMAKLGDMVCTTPMFRALKRAYPGVHLTVVGQKGNRDLLAGHPDVDEYVAFTGLGPFIRTLRAGRFDFGCIAGPNTFLLAGLLLGRVSSIAAPSIKGGRTPLVPLSYRILTGLVSTRPHTMGCYAPREYLRLLEVLGIETDDTKKTLTYSPEAGKTADEFLAAHARTRPIIGIAPSAGNKVKEWPAERFAKVSDALSADGASIVLIGGPADTERGEAVRAAATQTDKIVNACGTFSIDESKALISKLDLFVGVDTGPVYIAEAFGIATVDIVGPMDEREQPPVGPRNVVVLPPGPRVPQLHIMDAHPRDPIEALRQAESIPAEAVIEACRGLLKKAIV